MRVARLHGVNDVRIHEEPSPTAGAGESLVRIAAVGLCGSDLHWFDQGGIGDATITRPIIPGHEMAGRAVDGPYAGRLVAIDPAIACGQCELCREGHPNLCPEVQFAGHSTLDGPMCELMAWPTHLLHPLPESMTAADGAVLEPLGVALHTWDLARPRLGASVLVSGCGPIGLLALQVARAAGAGRIVTVDPLAHRREAALRYGADAAVSPDEATDEVWREHFGLGCEVSIEACGNDASIAQCLAAARPGAKVMLAGIPDDDRSFFAAGPARRKGLTLMLVRRMKEMYERTIPLVADGHVDVRSIVTDTYPLAQTQEAFTTAVAREGLKVVVAPDV